MKQFILIISIICLLACQSNSAFIHYRNDPFQFPYPEYYLKAKEITLQNFANNSDQVLIEFDTKRIAFNLGKNFSVKKEKKSNSYYLWANGKILGLLNFETEVFMGCIGKAKLYQKDFCGAFNSTEEYFLKLFTLTPNDLVLEKYAGVGNKWIVHNKGSWFKNVNLLIIYHFKDGVAFRRDFNSETDQKMKTELIIFHKNIAPNYIGIGLTTSDNELVENVIASLQIYAQN